MSLILLSNLVTAIVPGPPFVHFRDPGPEHYVCAIKEVRRLGDEGLLIVKQPSEFNAQVGDIFSVDRNTGEVIGNGEQATTRRSLRADNITVHDRGSEGTVFTLSWRFPRDIYVLHIREYQEGPEKPFVFAGALEIVAGTCR